MSRRPRNRKYRTREASCSSHRGRTPISGNIAAPRDSSQRTRLEMIREIILKPSTAEPVSFTHNAIFFKMTPSESASLYAKLGSAGLYALSSFLIVVVNKVVLTGYGFPSFQVLGLGQMVATVCVLYVLRLIGLIQFPYLDFSIPRKVWPLPALYCGNLVFGLASTKQLSLPMMTVLRRFSILMTMTGEYFVLGRKASISVQLSVYAMIFGAIVAALNDLAFEMMGYVFVLMNDAFTAANGVVSKQKLDARDLGKNGLTYYNALFMLLPLILFTCSSGDFHQVYAYQNWLDVGFLAAFLTSCFMGTALMYCTVMCTHYNSALTTTVIGCLKNIVVTYYGMVFSSDYIFTWANFIGLNISIAASIVYSYVVFAERPSAVVLPTVQKSAAGKLLHT